MPAQLDYCVIARYDGEDDGKDDDIDCDDDGNDSYNT